MIGREWKVGNHYFWNADEYQAALRDQKLIDSLETTYHLHDLKDLDKLYNEISQGHIRFESIIGREFDDKVYETRLRLQEEAKEKKEQEKRNKEKKKKSALSKNRGRIRESNIIPIQNEKKRKTEKPENRKNETKTGKDKKVTKLEDLDKDMQKAVLQVWKQKEKRRKQILLCCSLVGIACISYFVHDMILAKNSSNHFEELAELKENALQTAENYKGGVLVQVNKDKSKDVDTPNVLTEYKTLYSKNKKLIGWIKIADTNIDYPVMQTDDNEYYLNHNFEQEEDKNGCIFMDSQCDVINHSTNYILYGHHMQSGNMFGNLYQYQDEEYGKKHHTIQFDTIYEKGTYELMYVFRSRVYSEEDISFKYYQFIDANSSKEFNSYMNEMAEISFYDTGITAKYGDQLLTLSTCDYEEKAGRFVVVCKKVK